MSESKPSYITKRFYDPLDDILDSPIAFNRSFKRITGSTVAALMLSQAWYWTKRKADDDGWFWKVGTEWEEETGLTRSEQETARKILVRLGLMDEDLRGVPATLYYHVNKEIIYEKLGIQFAETLQTRLRGSDQQVSGILANINRNTETTPRNTHVARKRATSALDKAEARERTVIEEAYPNRHCFEGKNNDLLPIVDWFVAESGIGIANGDVPMMNKTLKEIRERGLTLEDFQGAWAVSQNSKSGFDVNRLQSLVKTATGLHGVSVRVKRVVANSGGKNPYAKSHYGGEK